MKDRLSLAFFWSESFLTQRTMLWILFWINFLGTLYGYEWYWNQMTVTIAEQPLWHVIFVPDSPTASLFFTLSLLYLIRDSKQRFITGKKRTWIREFVEAFALITSWKYGIWAVSMIWSAAYQGNPVSWQDWMLTISHLGMAVEALIFARFYTYGWTAVSIVAIWTLWNDFMDYHRGTFPWLPQVLMEELGTIELFTIGLSITGIFIASLFRLSKRNKQSKYF